MKGKSLILELTAAGGKEMVEEFAVVARRIWMRKNHFVFQQEFRSPNSVAKLAKETLLELKACPTGESHQPGPVQHETLIWNPPPTNFFKINWDAAVDKFRCEIGIGVIIKDWNGRVVVTSRQHRPLFPDPLLAEAMGAMEAACLGQQLGLQRIILEGDSKEVISAINNSKENWSSTGMIIADVKNQLNSFADWSATHVRREGNQAAHELAKDALLHSISSVEMGNTSHGNS